MNIEQAIKGIIDHIQDEYPRRGKILEVLEDFPEDRFTKGLPELHWNGSICKVEGLDFDPYLDIISIIQRTILEKDTITRDEAKVLLYITRRKAEMEAAEHAAGESI